MLFRETVQPATLELLKALMHRPALSGLRLVGGTSLSLQIGHRMSDDLDLFGEVNLDSAELAPALDGLGPVTLLKRTPNIYICSIREVKVDLVNYSYPWLEEIHVGDGIRLAGLSDIAAMKLAAVTGRGTKKDFVDLYFLLQYFTLTEMLDFYNKKYKDGSEMLVLRSLTYFEDADQGRVHMIKPLSWDTVKATLQNEVKLYMASFS